MITIAVTGSSGKLGRHVVRDLHEHGYRTVALDRVPDPDSVADATVRVDFTDHGQVIEAFTAVDDRYDGVDAVVHLAAIPAPGLTTPTVRTLRHGGWFEVEVDFLYRRSLGQRPDRGGEAVYGLAGLMNQIGLSG